MYFRSQKKLQGEVSLSETIESDREGNALQLMDVIGVDDTMLEDLYDRDSALRLRRLVKECLTQRESEVIRLRYGLGGTVCAVMSGAIFKTKSLTIVTALCIAY